ncbi:MAG TPA: helix-turn-helix transcriptional regulator [Pseudonocardiaceae bacterium]|jgi:transcriptional regulator with XRE-family HTH domain
MSEVVTGSTAPRRQLGRYLRDLRKRSRMTVRLAAETLEWSEAKIWRIETGQTSMRSLDVAAVCRVYAARSDMTKALMGLAKETRARGWWPSYGDVTRGLRRLHRIGRGRDPRHRTHRRSGSDQ